MLPRPVYKKVLKSIDFYRQKNVEDRLENPSKPPCGWRSMIEMSIRRILRENHVRVTDAVVSDTIKYLIDKGLLVDYHGDLAFPGEPLPSREEIEDFAMKAITGVTERKTGPNQG